MIGNIAQSDSQSTTVSSVNSQKSSETSTSRVQNSFTQAEAHLSLFNKQEAATRSEIFYLLESIKSNSPLSACDEKKELFQVMFPGSVSNAFTLFRTKRLYLLIHALFPYFQNLLLAELQEPNENHTTKKQSYLDIRKYLND